MIRFGDAADPDQHRLETVLSHLAGADTAGLRYDPAIPGVVSPIHRGVENACFRVEGLGEAVCLVRLPRADQAAFLDPAVTAAAAAMASEAGIGPQVLHTLSAPEPALVLEWLSPEAGWDWGKLGHFLNPDRAATAMTALKRFHGLHPLGAQRSVIDRLADYAHRLGQHDAPVPADVPALVTLATAVHGALAADGMDLTPCRGDAVASNMMVGPDGQVLLIDFDWAADSDPHHDLGATLNELFRAEIDWHRCIEVYQGHSDSHLFARCKLYGFLDDVMWALWGFLNFATSPRRDVEFTKYGEWRLLRARWTRDQPEWGGWLQRVGGAAPVRGG